MKSLDEFWSINEGTFSCLHDKKRTLAFKKAINNTIKKGDVVLDLGAGSGILSMFAVDAGAIKVYSVEVDETNVRTLKSVVVANNYQKQIQIIKADATTVKIPEKVDVIICEMVSTGLLDELQIPAMNHALKFLKKGGRVLLSTYKIQIDLVYSKDIFYNKKFPMIRFELPEMRDMKSTTFSERVCVKTVDFRIKHKNFWIEENLKIKILKPGTINAIRITGETCFYDGSKFEYSTSYDFPLILPIPNMIVTKNEKLLVKLKYKLCFGSKTLNFSVTKI